MVTYSSFMVPLHLFSSTLHDFLSLQLRVSVWGISPSRPTMCVDSPHCLPAHCISVFKVTVHWCVCHYQPWSEALLFPGFRQRKAPLQDPDHSALICFPNLSLSGISAVTQKAAIHMDHLPVSFSSALFLCVLSLSLHLSAPPLCFWISFLL